MTEGERREKARRIAEAYFKLRGEPVPNYQREAHISALTDIAYDNLCWAEAMAEVDGNTCNHDLQSPTNTLQRHPAETWVRCTVCNSTWGRV